MGTIISVLFAAIAVGASGAYCIIKAMCWLCGLMDSARKYHEWKKVIEEIENGSSEL